MLLFLFKFHPTNRCILQKEGNYDFISGEVTQEKVFGWP
jgi:hypothetical protein